jgi:hypothetical protein
MTIIEIIPSVISSFICGMLCYFTSIKPKSLIIVSYLLVFSIIFVIAGNIFDDPMWLISIVVVSVVHFAIFILTILIVSTLKRNFK